MFKKILASLDTHSKGYSSRKLTALVFVLFTFYIENKYATESNVAEIAVINSCVIVMCLGIVTAEQIIKFKNGNDETHTTA